jgi:hypothetical protein
MSGRDQSELRCAQIEREALKLDITLSTVTFLRDDVYEWLVERASDRGKDTVVRVAWNDTALLKDIIERRLDASSAQLRIDPSLTWSDIVEDDNDGVFEFLVRHSMRRPRILLDLIELCLSNASLGRRAKITIADARRAISSYSVDILRSLNYEIRDIFPKANKLIYTFARQQSQLDHNRAVEIGLAHFQDQNQTTKFIEILLWFGFLGLCGPDGSENYVFDFGDDLDLLKSHSVRTDNPKMCIHPLFRPALSIAETLTQ